MLRYQLPEYIFPLNGKWQKINDDWLRELETSNRKKYNAFDDYICRYQKNPLSFFLPHGRPRADGTNDGLAFINDTENDLLLLISPEQCGKSIHGAAFMCLRYLPCDPTWPCFTKHGIKYHKWPGGQPIVIASYSWDEVSTVWNTYRKIMPREILGPYSPWWGCFRGERGKPRDLRFHNITKRIKWDCGTEFIFLSYVQSITHWTGKQARGVHLDEQAKEENVDQVTSRQRTMSLSCGNTPIICTLTGHKLEDRPDTGAQGWIKTKMINRGITKGRKFAQYHIAIEDVPEQIMSKEAKHAAWIQWVDEPEKTNNEKKKREAVAKYWGGWEEGGGIVLSEWNPDFHWIEPFNIWKYLPTLHRYIDHGQTPCAAAWVAVMPWGDEIVFQEYYEFGHVVSKNAELIVARSGNDRKFTDWGEGQGWYEEVFNKMEFRTSEMDCRSFAHKADESGKTLGRLYNESGLFCTRSSGIQDRKNGDKAEGGLIPLLKERLSIKRDRLHIDYRLKRERDESLRKFGAPQLYVFNTCKNLRAEIESWIGEPKQADHLISCFARGTLITTKQGCIPIDKVKIGNLVLTRKGYKSVIDTGMTSPSAKVVRLTLSNGKTLVVTPNHPVYVENKGFIAVDNLTKDMVLFPVENLIGDGICKQWKELCSTESCLEGIQNQKEHQIANTFGQTQDISKMVLRHFMWKYGRLPMEMFLEVLKFITRTATPATMLLKILNALRPSNIKEGILKFIPMKELPDGTKGEPLGINPQKELNGIGNTELLQQSTCLEPSEFTKENVCNAAKNTNTKVLMDTGNTVHRHAGASTTIKLESTTRPESVSIAENIFLCGSTESLNSVRVIAVHLLDTTCPVYNLSVEDCPEYFANGILVHNCLKWHTSTDRPYMGDYGHYKEEKREERNNTESSITGY